MTAVKNTTAPLSIAENIHYSGADGIHYSRKTGTAAAESWARQVAFEIKN
jgi:hypothetical protein